MTKSSLTAEQLRKQVQIRLADRRLPLTTVGIYKVHRGTGRHCLVCRREIAPKEDQYEVQGAGVVLIAHEACYLMWREESLAFVMSDDPRQQRSRS